MNFLRRFFIYWIMKKFIINFFIGILIGFGAILPGVSSGVFCVIFGIYENLIYCVSNFFKNFKQNFLYLFSIAFGAFVGIVLFGNIVKYFFFKYQAYSSFVFIGLILGTIPALFKQASTTPKPFNIKKLVPLIFSFLLGVSLIFIENYFYFTNLALSFSSYSWYLFLSGFLMSIGIVVPGISNTVILMCLGVYSKYISAIASLNLNVLIPMGIGILVGSLLWIKIIKSLFEKHHEQISYSIIGFTLGSVFVLFPGFIYGVNEIICIILFLISLLLSYKLANLESKN